MVEQRLGDAEREGHPDEDDQVGVVGGGHGGQHERQHQLHRRHRHQQPAPVHRVRQRPGHHRQQEQRAQLGEQQHPHDGGRAGQVVGQGRGRRSASRCRRWTGTSRRRPAGTCDGGRRPAEPGRRPGRRRRWRPRRPRRADRRRRSSAGGRAGGGRGEEAGVRHGASGRGRCGGTAAGRAAPPAGVVNTGAGPAFPGPGRRGRYRAGNGLPACQRGPHRRAGERTGPVGPGGHAGGVGPDRAARRRSGAFVAVDGEAALAEAAVIDERIAGGEDVGPWPGCRSGSRTWRARPGT